MGIQPDFLIVRGEKPLDDRRRERLALFCNIKADHVINNPDVASVYELPLILHQQKLDAKILHHLRLADKPSRLQAWKTMVNQIKSPPRKTLSIAIVGKYFKTGEYNLADSYAALIEALKHAAVFHQFAIDFHFINAELIEAEDPDKYLANIDGLVVPIGWGARGTEGKITAIRYAREHQIPFLGLCYGMQLAVIEFARHVAGLKNANSEEINPKTPHPVIHIIPEQKRNLKKRAYGGTMRLGSWDAYLQPQTYTYAIYDKYHGFKDKTKNLVSERHRHRYEFNDAYADQLTAKGLVIAGRSVEENLVEFIELPRRTHPFFVATQGHPEYKSRPLAPHPLFLEFLLQSSKF